MEAIEPSVTSRHGLFPQREHIVSQLHREPDDRIAIVVRDGSKSARTADAKLKRAGSRQKLRFGPCLECTRQVARHNRRVGTRDQPRDARSKATDGATARPRAFRKDDEHRVRLRQQLSAHLKAVAAIVPIEWQAIHRDCRKIAAQRCREEVVSCRDRKGIVDARQWQAGKQTDCIQVARVVANHHE